MSENILNFQEEFISLSIEDDGENNPICTIKLDDEQELAITMYEYLNLFKIMQEHGEEISTYFKNVLKDNYGIEK